MTWSIIAGLLYLHSSIITYLFLYTWLMISPDGKDNGPVTSKDIAVITIASIVPIIGVWVLLITSVMLNKKE